MQNLPTLCRTTIKTDGMPVHTESGDSMSYTAELTWVRDALRKTGAAA